MANGMVAQKGKDLKMQRKLLNKQRQRLAEEIKLLSPTLQSLSQYYSTDSSSTNTSDSDSSDDEMSSESGHDENGTKPDNTQEQIVDEASTEQLPEKPI